MVDRLGNAKNYSIVFSAKYRFISKKNTNYQIPLNRHLTHPFVIQVRKPRMQKQIILPSLEHSNIFVQCLNVCLVDFSECCAVVLGGK